MWQKIWQFFSKNKKRCKVNSEQHTSIDLVQTPVQNLQPGMYVSELDKPWLETNFPFQGFILETEEDIEAVRDVCQYVYIDVSKQKKTTTDTKMNANAVVNKAVKIGNPPERRGTFETEIIQADLTYQETGALVTDFMEKVASGGGIDGKLAKEAVSACVNSVLHSPDAFLWLSQLKDADKYTAQHSLNVCVLSILLGRQIGLSEHKLNNVGLCGMMHDMGKMLVPLDILNKPGKLEPDELQIMQSHTTLGYELLKSSENMFHGAVETALTHHEKHNGKGYPRKINARGLSYYSNIVAIADMYDAITSDRVYQKGRTHHEATKIMLDVSGQHLDSELVVKFIESLGVYPPGSYVQLSNGAIALVVEESSQFKLRPKVLLIRDQHKNPLEPQVIDLSVILTDSSETMLTIRGIISPSDYQIDSRKYYQETQQIIQSLKEQKAYPC